MDFSAVLFFLFLYYIRPHDWLPALNLAKPITVTMAWALGSMFMRPGGFTVRALFSTPLQWGMFIYLVYIFSTAKDFQTTFEDSKSAFIFFVVTFMALSTMDRVEKYVRFWMWMLVLLCGIGVASLFGLDLTGAKETTTAMQGRLCINTVMHSNPNALGHSVVIAIPLLYFGLIWRQPSGRRILACALIPLVAYCVYATESKGAFLVGFATIVASQMLGRPRLVQAIIAIIAASFGVIAVTQLPRMESMNRNEPGIQGRILAWEMARTAMKDNPTGKGWNNFTAEFRYEKEWVTKATHSSYVQIGASLGAPGLFIYATLFTLAFRTLLSAATRTDQEERVRRMLFTILFSGAVSNFMVDRAYTVEVFIMVAAISAFHRLMHAPAGATADELDALPADAEVYHQPAMALAGGGALEIEPVAREIAYLTPAGPSAAADVPSAPSEEWPAKALKWNRLGVLDVAFGAVFFWVILRIWDYTITGHW